MYRLHFDSLVIWYLSPSTFSHFTPYLDFMIIKMMRTEADVYVYVVYTFHSTRTAFFKKWWTNVNLIDIDHDACWYACPFALELEWSPRVRSMGEFEPRPSHANGIEPLIPIEWYSRRVIFGEEKNEFERRSVSAEWSVDRPGENVVSRIPMCRYRRDDSNDQVYACVSLKRKVFFFFEGCHHSSGAFTRWGKKK